MSPRPDQGAPSTNSAYPLLDFSLKKLALLFIDAFVIDFLRPNAGWMVARGASRQLLGESDDYVSISGTFFVGKC